MRKFFLLSAATLLSAVVSAQTVARMDDLKPEQKSMAVSLKLTGELSTTGNSDYRQLRDLCFQMRSVDLSEAQSTAIPNNAFHSRHQLEQITLPTAAKSIGSQAFFACDKLGKIIIPAGVESIGAAAFSGCTALEEIIIKGNPQIGEYAFARLVGLKTVRVDSKVPPKADATAFYGLNRQNVKLIVPKGSEKLYRKAAGWSLFFSDTKEPYQVSKPDRKSVV